MIIKTKKYRLRTILLNKLLLYILKHLVVCKKKMFRMLLEYLLFCLNQINKLVDTIINSLPIQIPNSNDLGEMGFI